MKAINRNRRNRKRKDSGFTLIEVMIASFLLLIVFTGLAQTYTRGRRQIGYEADRRKATAILQARVDCLRRDYSYDTLPSLSDTTYVVGNRSYTVSHSVSTADPELNSTTLSIQVSWTAKTESGTVNRTEDCTTILSRGLPTW